MRFFTLLIFSLFVFPVLATGQIIINEIQSANTSTIADEDGEYEDWLELYNAGTLDENLGGYGLSDNPGNAFKWTLPSIVIAPADHLLVFASEKDRKPIVDHYETVIYPSETWKYFVGVFEPDITWKNPGFDDSFWLSGVGGVGYGDGDDGTEIGTTISLYIRKEFTIIDTGAILQLVLDADYDDAFVAYLNGIEITRAGIGIPGIPPPFDQIADFGHEALVYQGYIPESFSIDKQTLSQLLLPGNNVLAIQVHNSDITSSDLSSNFYFSVGISNGSFTYGQPPFWLSTDQMQLHTNFKISSTGETITLTDPAGIIADQKTVDYLTPNKSIQRTMDGAADWCISASPTPGNVNTATSCFAGYLAEPSFSLEAGFYSGSQVVSIFNNSVNSILRYTIDGSIPDTNATIYTSSLQIDSTVVVKAKAFPLSTDFLPSKTTVNTYFINENMTNAVVSLSIDPFDLFDPDSGIYVFGDTYDTWFPYYGSNFWEDWEREGYAEYFDVNSQQQFELPIGLKVQGNWSRGFPQKAWQILARDIYGGSTIHYQLFPDKGSTTFENFNLRCGGIDWNTVHFRDDLMQRNVRNTHLDIMSSYPCVVFLNGNYWGIYHIREREDEYYLQNNHGVDPNKVDLLRYDGDVMAGSADDFWQMDYFIEHNSMVDSANFQTASNWLDLENFADYFITETYYSNSDWLVGYTNNIKYWRTNDPPGKWRYVLWDTDGGLGLFTWYDYNILHEILHPSYYNPHSYMLDNLLNNPVYRNYFINRYADLMNTVFLPNHLTELAWTIRDSINTELPRHFDRWGEYNPDWYGWGTSYNFPTYNQNFNSMLDWINQRPAYQLTYIEQEFFLQGHHNITLETQPPAAGSIKISTLIPESLPWTGIYFHGNPVMITAIAERGYVFDHWEANDLIAYTTDASVSFDPSENETFTAVFTGSSQPLQLSVSEIMYHPDSTLDGGDWFELHNYGNYDLDISDWSIKDSKWYHQFTFPAGTTIPANGYRVFAAILSQFQLQYPLLSNVTGSLGFEFSNDQDVIQVLDRQNQPVLSVAYADTFPWRRSADGWGRSLELKSDLLNPNDPGSWFDGCVGGSPGGPYTTCPAQLVFGEINYHSSSDLDAGDWIELYNYGSVPMDISSWGFMDDQDNDEYVFPSATIIEANERLVLYNDLSKFTTTYPDVLNISGPFSFGLDAGGEPLRLYDAVGKLYNSIVYDDQNPWPLSPDGAGFTLELINPLMNLCDGTNYFAGCLGGSPGTPFLPCITSVESATSSQVELFPNPAESYCYIKISEQSARLTLLDFSGRKMLDQILVQQVTRVNLTSLSQGIYWYRFENENGMIETGKLIIQ